jgi:hypothetical protein
MKCTFKINEFQTTYAKVTYNAPNELRVSIYGMTKELNEFLEKQEFSKSTVHVTEYHKVPPKCPNCNHELPMYMGFGNYEPQKTWEYCGALIKKAEPSDDGWELIVAYDDIILSE